MDVPRPHPTWLRLSFFWVGITATFAYRAILVLERVGQGWVRLAWYVGTLGFVIYFAHRYQVSARRARLIHEYGLVEKTLRLGGLESRDRAAMEYVFQTLESSKEKWNYIAIFSLSATALVLDLVLYLASR